MDKQAQEHALQHKAVNRIASETFKERSVGGDVNGPALSVQP